MAKSPPLMVVEDGLLCCKRGGAEIHSLVPELLGKQAKSRRGRRKWGRRKGGGGKGSGVWEVWGGD